MVLNNSASNRSYISVVIPVYGCASALIELCERLHSVLQQITDNYEILLVNDASPDSSWDCVKVLAKQDDRVKGLSLSRNFGQHRAITAGLDFANGDWIVVMDCDLQDLPEEIPKLYSTALDGYDVVVGKRVERKDGWFKRQLSKRYAKAYSYLTGITIDESVGNFGIYSKKVIDSLKLLKEQNRSFGLFINWVGFKRAEINIKHAARLYGASSYTFFKMLKLAIDSITAYSDRLLILTIKIGLLFTGFSFFYALYLIIIYLFISLPPTGWTSVIVTLFFVSGLIIFSIGIIGLYVGKVFDEVKKRPIYIIDKTTF